MIVVRVELHSAITRTVKELARMHICNEATSEDGKKADYSAQTFRGRCAKDLDKRIVQRTSEVKGHRRLSLHVWHLVYKSLREMGFEKE